MNEKEPIQTASNRRTREEAVNQLEDNVWTDPIVQKIRRERETYAAKFNYDLEAIVKDIKRQEQESGREFVTPASKRRAAETEEKQLQTAQGG